MQHDKNESRLDRFLDMFDAVEDDISEMLSDENEKPPEIGGYECLFIAFSNLSLYCASNAIHMEKVEAQYRKMQESQIGAESDGFTVHEDLDENNEVVNFCKLLEQIENRFSACEEQYEKANEVFDEWDCILIMYSYLKSYCVKKSVDFEKLQKEISLLHKEMEKDKEA